MGGSIIYSQRVVTQGAFRVLPTVDDAGRLVGFTLGGLHWLGVIAAVIYLVATVALGALVGALAQPAAIGVILMLVMTLASQRIVFRGWMCCAPRWVGGCDGGRDPAAGGV